VEQGHDLLPFIFKFASEYAIRRVLENLENLKLNRTHKLLGLWW